MFQYFAKKLANRVEKKVSFECGRNLVEHPAAPCDGEAGHDATGKRKVQPPRDARNSRWQRREARPLHGCRPLERLRDERVADG